ncbi:IS1182 family transposase [Sciscionella marina]|uniref:IS1182 family transposase n=1 Tax=Sciscionella marina TaxID=508770 RepID=UPI0006867C83|nr:IS1182 family transposase [Sciscionella marina]
MSLRPNGFIQVPVETERVAWAAFPKGCLAMRVRDELGSLFRDEQFTDLFAIRGKPALSPWRLALVSVLQFVEGLSDRQAVEALRARIDWKYLLGLELTDTGFDASVLSEFRDRLVGGDDTARILRIVVERLSTVGLVKAGGRARTDSTHVLAAVRNLNRFELVGEILRAALEALAVCAPDWLRLMAPTVWYERYERRADAYRLPNGEAARIKHAVTVGTDGFALLAAADDHDAPGWLQDIPAVRVLRAVWDQHYEYQDGQVRWRANKELPPARDLIRSPFDIQARYTVKRNTGWVGYKAHLTETCEPDAPHVLTHVATVPATTTDVELTSVVQDDLAEQDLLPETHLVDTGYTSAGLLVSSRRDHGIELLGPVSLPTTQQAKDNAGFDTPNFTIDWDNQHVTCPRGAVSTRWHETTRNGVPFIETAFSARDCTPCPVRSHCTRSPKAPRGMSFHTRENLEALYQARHNQESPQWKERYKLRAGIESTIAQTARRCGLRQSRYRGLAKTHLQNVLTATAVNLIRIDAWLTGTPLGPTRTSHFSALQIP